MFGAKLIGWTVKVLAEMRYGTNVGTDGRLGIVARRNSSNMVWRKCVTEIFLLCDTT